MSVELKSSKHVVFKKDPLPKKYEIKKLVRKFFCYTSSHSYADCR